MTNELLELFPPGSAVEQDGMLAIGGCRADVPNEKPRVVGLGKPRQRVGHGRGPFDDHRGPGFADLDRRCRALRELLAERQQDVREPPRGGRPADVWLLHNATKAGREEDPEFITCGETLAITGAR